MNLGNIVRLCLYEKFFKFFVEMRSCCAAQAGLELLSSSDPPALASQNVGIIGVSHCTWPVIFLIKLFILR